MMLEINKSRTTAYHPQSDGLVERMNRTLEAMLAMFTSNSQRDWDEYLPYVMMAYRSAVQDTTGYSPNQMMLGRETELPIDILIGHPEEDVIEGHQNRYVDEMKQKMTLVHETARKNIKIRSDRQKRNYDLKAQPRRYEPGEAVWLHNFARKKGIRPKLSRTWEGPYLIVDRLSDVTYRIQQSVKSKKKVVHFDRLKLYTGDSPPNWQVKRSDEQTMLEMGDEDTILNVVSKDEIKENENQDVDMTLIDNEGNDTILYEYKEDHDSEDIDCIVNDNEGETTVLYKYKDENELDNRRSKRTIRKPARFRDD
jgi:hypothetical protein